MQSCFESVLVYEIHNEHAVPYVDSVVIGLFLKKKKTTAARIRTVTTFVPFMRCSSAGAVIPCYGCVHRWTQCLLHFGTQFAAVVAEALFSKQAYLEHGVLREILE